jgi:hypothetical protein
MARKRAKKMPAVQEEKDVKRVRLDLSPADYSRLERCARERGLSKSSYSRQAVLEQIRVDEGRKGAI